MNKIFRISGIAAVLAAAIAFAGVTAAFAQGPNQPDDVTPRGRAQVQGNANAGIGLMAVDEDAMHAAIADALDISIEEFEAAAAEGKTLFVLAQELGVDFAEVQAAMDAVHQAASQQAVTDGLVTQEQVNWMLSRRGGQNGQGNGINGGLSGSPMGGRSQRSFGANNGDCIYQTS